MYWFFSERRVSLSSCREADGVIDGRGGDGAIVIEDGSDVVLNTEVDSWVITSWLSTPTPLK